MSPPGSDVWHAMLDGAEDILREEGHAQLTSRRSSGHSETFAFLDAFLPELEG